MTSSSAQLGTSDAPGRRDWLLDQAFLDATDGAVSTPNILQQALFPRLSTQDTGLVVCTGPAAGRLEGVFVPVLTETRSEDYLHRLFIVAPDHGLLDDYIYRLVPYVRSLAVNRNKSLTLYVDADEPFCRMFRADGSHSDDVCAHPLDATVDVAVARLTQFRSLFFGAGGVHALPNKLEPAETSSIDIAPQRRDLFYFDEAQSYGHDDFSVFVKLVEFLYAEDLDVLVGSTTLPVACKEQLCFLEFLSVPEASYQPGRLITSVMCDGEAVEDLMVNLVKERYFQSSRVGVACEDASAASAVHRRLVDLYPQGVYLYSSGQAPQERLSVYAQLRELEKEGEGYLLICEGVAFETADLDVNQLISTLCAPEALLRRAGRCNRRGDLVNGDLIIVDSAYEGRALSETRLSAYLDALAGCTATVRFWPEFWQSFIV